jgi:hypothetical protein
MFRLTIFGLTDLQQYRIEMWRLTGSAFLMKLSQGQEAEVGFGDIKLT